MAISAVTVPSEGKPDKQKHSRSSHPERGQGRNELHGTWISSPPYLKNGPFIWAESTNRDRDVKRQKSRYISPLFFRYRVLHF